MASGLSVLLRCICNDTHNGQTTRSDHHHLSQTANFDRIYAAKRHIKQTKTG